MKVIEDNKGLIIFYICVSIFMMIWASQVENNNNIIMHQKSYVLTSSK